MIKDGWMLKHAETDRCFLGRPRCFMGPHLWPIPSGTRPYAATLTAETCSRDGEVDSVDGLAQKSPKIGERNEIPCLTPYVGHYCCLCSFIYSYPNNPMNDVTIFRTKCQFCRFPPVCDKPAEAVNQTRSGTYHINEIKRFHQIKWTEEKTQKIGHRFADKLCHQMEPQFHSTTISCHATGPPCCLQYPQMPNADSAGPGQKHEEWWSWTLSPVGVENMRKHVWMCSETFWNPGSFWRIWWPAPVDRWFIPLFIGFQPSKVVQDFFHPQYQHFIIFHHCPAWSIRKSNKFLTCRRYCCSSSTLCPKGETRTEWIRGVKEGIFLIHQCI